MGHFARLSSPGKLEYVFYFFVWSGSLLYGSYQLYIVSQANRDRLKHRNVIRPGWLYPGSYRDTNDFEWNFWKYDNYLFIPLNILRTIVYRFFSTKLPPQTLLAFDIFAVTCLLGFTAAVFQIALCGLFFIVALANVPVLTWVLAVSLTLLRFVYPLRDTLERMGFYDAYRVEGFTCYLVVRCISFAFDYSRNMGYYDSLPLRHTLYDFMRYAFFLPLTAVGPMTSFDDFCKKSDNPAELRPWEILRLVFKIIACAFLYECLSHFIYALSIRHDKHLLRNLNAWAASGNGYDLGQFFQLKYMFLFGTTSLFALLNGVDSLQLPICVAEVHRYSLMWKYFDGGLYVFLKRYIYIPLAKKKLGSALSTSFCYAFIYIWHGTTVHIFLWTGLNWVALMLENLIYGNIKDLRLQGLANSPVIILSMASNMFFLGESYDFGYELFRKVIWENSAINLLGIFVIFYSFSMIGEVFQKVKRRRHQLEMKAMEVGSRDAPPRSAATIADAKTF